MYMQTYGNDSFKTTHRVIEAVSILIGKVESLEKEVENLKQKIDLLEHSQGTHNIKSEHKQCTVISLFNDEQKKKK